MYIEKEHREHRALNSPRKDHIIAHIEVLVQIVLIITITKSSHISTQMCFQFYRPCSRL